MYSRSRRGGNKNNKALSLHGSQPAMGPEPDHYKSKLVAKEIKDLA